MEIPLNYLNLRMMQKNIYPDVLKHLQQNHIPIIMAFHSGSKEVLKYLALYPEAFRFKALTAILL